MSDARRDAVGRTVILGASGFVGRALAAHLGGAGLGADVHGFTSKTLDLRDRAALAALDPLAGPETTLVFCSAITPDKGRTLDALDANLQMALNVARYVEAHPFRKLVYLSSDAVYPPAAETVDERTPADPRDVYALAKYAAERVLQLAARASSTPLLVLRPTGIFGPGDTHNSYGPNRFITQIANDGKVTLFGPGDDVRDHIYVEDVARLNARLAASDATGLVNLATGESRTFASVVELLRALAPTPFEVVNLPRSGGPTRRAYDVSRLHALLPDLAFTPFEDALRQTVAARLGGAR